MKTLMDTARPLVDRYNEKLAAAERERLETNRVVLAELKQGTITCEEAERRMVHPLQQARVKVNHMWAHRFRKQWGWVSVGAHDAYGSRPQDCGEACCCQGQCLMGEFCCGGRRSCDRDGRQRHSPHYCNICDPDLLEHC